ncbi:dihydrolipoamide acetyltransferase family protein [Egicoccus halophilus]|uniref:Dihydrolipoamide acetyltransferase component of pyruvate dehydrogenase complex n=1 Tax=Egicoccus halophilus TaxID=1670830 RepID=A0A8J3AF22_9ACTN|nr:dihydrolipoamide acetyltransferase family protein [Egicoccus halophilus]GGI06278.1 dihydrolipoamide acetyltransferase component of pyruvate dehydrogenase complex [Egicoccus halophilus]
MADVKDFKLPDLGEGLEEGEIVEWHVAVGDVIELNQTVASVETAKAVVDVPSPFAGRVVEQVGEVGEALQVGTVFLRIDLDVEGGAVVEDEPATLAATEASPAQGGFEAGAAAAAKSVEENAGLYGEVHQGEAGAKSTGLDADEEPQPLVGYGQGKGGARRRRRGGAAADAADDGQAQAAPVRPLAKPPVRKLAKDLGVDLADIAPGSGPEGVITREDVHAAASGGQGAQATAAATQTPASAPAPTAGVAAASAADPFAGFAGGGEKVVPGFRGRTPGEVEPIRGIRKRIVEKMEVSRREIPEATCTKWADLTELWELRKDLTEQARADGFDVKVTPFALILRAVVLGLRRFPTLNGMIDREAGEIRLHEHVNLGFAADTDRGLVVPNIKDAHGKSTLQIAAELNRLATAARDGSIGAGDMTGGTFTVSNYGAFGNDDGNPIINHPEGAILGVGAIEERPWVVQGELAVRRTCKFSLVFDHRISDGGEAGRFVTYVANLCENPARILLHS